MATKKAAKKTVTKKSAAAAHAARRKAVLKSYQDVQKAQKNLDLKVKKHQLVISSMFFPG